MYAYISKWSIIGTSDEILPISAEVVETFIEWPIELLDGEIIAKISKTKDEIRSLLISTPDLSSVDLEWVTFTDIEIGEIIRSRVFAGNPYAEAALQAKTSAYLLSVILGNPNEELLISIQEKQRAINEVRVAFGLSSIQ